MMKVSGYITMALTVAALCVGFTSESFCEGCVVENEFIRRSVVADHGVRTDSIVDVKKGVNIPIISAGFRIVFQDGSELRANNFEVVSSKGTAGECSYELNNADAGINAVLKFIASPGEPWVRKILEIHAPARNISEVEIERFRFAEDENGKSSVASGGGKLPIYFERVFVAGEDDGYEASYKEGVALISYSGSWEKSLIISSAIGVAEGDSPLNKSYEAFHASKAKNSVVRKTITAISLPPEYEKFEAYDRRKYFEDMMKLFGAPQNGPAAVVLNGVDDMATSVMAKKYLNADAAMVVNAKANGSGVACSDSFASRASHMDGVLDRFGKSHPQLIVIRGLADCAARQDEKNLSENISKYVHDIRSMAPSALIAGDYSSSSLNLFDFIVYGDDMNGMLLPPSSRSVMGRLTKRDAVIFNALASDPRLKKTGFFAITGEMSGNPVVGGYAQEALAQEVALKLFTGGAAAYLKIDFTKMTDAGAATVAALVNWAAKNSEIMSGSLSLLGPSPLDGKPYGYSRFGASGDGIVIVRNPSFLSSQFELKIDAESGFRAGGEYRLRIAYPYEAALSRKIAYGDSINIPIEREQMMILEVARAGEGSFVNSDIPMELTSGSAVARELKKTENASGVEGVYIFNVPEHLRANLMMYMETSDADAHKSINASFVLNGDAVTAERFESFGKAEGEEAPSGWVMYNAQLKSGENRVGFSVVSPGVKVWSWLLTENDPADGAPLFKSGLPARWNSVTKSDIRLF